MINEATGNMFHGGHQALVCPVNMVGTMGNGLAKYFDLRYPGLVDQYREACRTKQFRDYRSVIIPIGSLDVICLPTKTHWRNDSVLSRIDKALKHLVVQCEQAGIEELGMPAIGCGKGNLDWEDVKFLIYHHFASSKIRVTIYPPT